MNSKFIKILTIFLVLSTIFNEETKETKEVQKNIIWNKIPSIEDLKLYADNYNKWINSILKDNIFELRANEEFNINNNDLSNKENPKKFTNYYNDGSQFKVFTTKDLISSTEKNEVQLYKLHSKHFITIDKVYNHPKLGEFVLDLEKKYGYDEVGYLSLYLIYEFYNPQSEFRALLDVLPSVPSTPAMLYWNNTGRIENELIGYSVLRKVVDYKINVDNKVRNMVNGLFKKNEFLFNSEIFHEENLTWAIYTIESLIQRLHYR